MKIGDEVYVHGHIEEIRGNTVIVKNKGGSFGTSKNEVTSEPGWSDDEFYQFTFSEDKFMVVVYEGNINLIKKDKAKVTVKFDQPDCQWK